MTITFTQLTLYAGALFILFITPGPVWVAVMARGLSGGSRAVIPLAMGVAIGDVLWPLTAIFGVGYLVSIYADFIVVLKYLGAVVFLLMGYFLIRNADKQIGSNSALTAPGNWAGFAAGFLAVLGNPKAILFYMGILPGFFDFSVLNTVDIVAICVVSLIVPFCGNMCLAVFVGQLRSFMATPSAVRKTNIGAGFALVFVGIAIAIL
jgi:threonine/homoserine/homoserine lactone efflux protein